MSIALRPFGMVLFVSSACAVELSVFIGVRGCRCPSSSSVCHIDTAIFALMNSAPSSASAADDMTAFIICDKFRTTWLLVGMWSWFARNMWPPSLLLAFASNRYDVSLWIASNMLLTQYVSIALSCDAV